MSPNAYACWNDEKRLLCAYHGEAEHEEPIFIWTYSVFEEYNCGAVTPSMYHFMSGYVQDHLTKDDLYDLATDEYYHTHIEEAVNAYYEIPIKERIEMHEQMLVNLQAEKERADAKEEAFIDACLDDNCPFDVTSPIYVEYCQWCREQKEKWSKIAFELANEMDEEENWYSGAEEWAVPPEKLQYDPSDE